MMHMLPINALADRQQAHNSGYPAAQRGPDNRHHMPTSASISHCKSAHWLCHEPLPCCECAHMDCNEAAHQPHVDHNRLLGLSTHPARLCALPCAGNLRHGPIHPCQPAGDAAFG